MSHFLTIVSPCFYRQHCKHVHVKYFFTIKGCSLVLCIGLEYRISLKLNQMSVMDTRLPAGMYHLVKEAQCGRRYEVCDGERLSVKS